jgi:RNA polymerase sigma-70 factor (ECF subfamily)
VKTCCQEAIRLTTLLAAHPIGNGQWGMALAALMLFNGARLVARTDPAGNILRLQEQDRQKWNQGMIARGLF